MLVNGNSRKYAQEKPLKFVLWVVCMTIQTAVLIETLKELEPMFVGALGYFSTQDHAAAYVAKYLNVLYCLERRDFRGVLVVYIAGFNLARRSRA